MIYKISLIIFLAGLFLIFSSEEIKQKMYLNKFILEYGVYIGIGTLISGLIFMYFFFEYIFLSYKNKKKINMFKNDLLRELKQLSLDEKKVFAYFIVNNTKTSNLDIKFESIQEPKVLKQLLAKGYLYKKYVRLEPFYIINNDIWALLHDNQNEIFYEEVFWSDK
nr:super-infection exclusion protein B [Arcobacter roscoffensis]